MHGPINISKYSSFNIAWSRQSKNNLSASVTSELRAIYARIYNIFVTIFLVQLEHEKIGNQK